MPERESLLETVLRNMRENGALNDGELRALRILAACDRREAARDAFEEGWHEHYLERDRQRANRSASPPREPHVDWPRRGTL